MYVLLQAFVPTLLACFRLRPRMSSSGSWRVRFARKRRSSSQVSLPQERRDALVPRPKRLRLRAPSAHGAAAPATIAQPAEPQLRQSTLQVPQGDSLDVLAQRLGCGRTLEALLLLADSRLLQFDGLDTLPTRDGGLTPKRGLPAKWGEQNVYILDAVRRWGVPHADVAPFVSEGVDQGGEETFSLGQMCTVEWTELRDISRNVCLQFWKTRPRCPP